MNELKYSVLMSVYYKEKPVYLKDCILSMLNQSILPDEIIVVRDGAVTEELQFVLDELSNNNIIKIIELSENVGLGKALSIGLNECKNELVARMDTDDISNINRCEKQLEQFKTDHNLSVLGTAVEEFIDEPRNVIAYKEVKITSEEINRQMKYRNPMNHPTVMFKKSDVLKSGGYKHFYLNEDYYLWLRMMQLGFKFKNIDEPLVKMRVSDDTYQRRGGWNYFLNQKRLLDYMLNNKMLNIFEYMFNILVRLAIRVLIPNNVRKIFYLNILRKRV